MKNRITNRARRHRAYSIPSTGTLASMQVAKMPNSQGIAPSRPMPVMKRSAKVWSQDSMLAATLYWYQAAATPPTDSKAASAAAMRVNARPPPKPPISAITPITR
ncbi:hypothetical protein G6F57_022162 [Rhizopus arrhizus]|nr:hypothetical protein G6F57_022162 [Rhizopus arrhizus]